jgi:hypothetical protein
MTMFDAKTDIDIKTDIDAKTSIDAKINTNVKADINAKIDTNSKTDIHIKINSNELIFNFPHTPKEMLVDTMPTLIKVQDMMANWNLVEDISIRPLNLLTTNYKS